MAPSIPCFDLGRAILSLLVLTLSISTIQALSSDDRGAPLPSVYEVLPKYGLPSGLLPDSVVSYTLDDDGNFAVSLAKPCYIQFDYLVYYAEKITGKLSYGSITNLEGIQVQKFFIWLDVDEIKVDLPPADSIYFHVGFINKKLDVDQFETVHSCRDGVSGASCKRFWERVIELPAPVVNETPLLITE
ncbi:unnamed protein product [Linum trigynum]|uniref:Uncharacterized protein n=1 Tax=Linum trigynum TaxID=586398 RepID=A0AAV2DJ94_9ROSI